MLNLIQKSLADLCHGHLNVFADSGKETVLAEFFAARVGLLEKTIGVEQEQVIDGGGTGAKHSDEETIQPG